MLKSVLLPLLSALILTGAAASAQDAPKPIAKEVTVPLIGGGGSVRTFEPTRGGDGVYIQSFRGDWYLARFYGPCFDLPFASAIGFTAFSSMSLDRGDTILAGNQRCRIASIVSSEGPPRKAKKPRSS